MGTAPTFVNLWFLLYAVAALLILPVSLFVKIKLSDVRYALLPVIILFIAQIITEMIMSVVFFPGLLTYINIVFIGYRIYQLTLSKGEIDTSTQLTDGFKKYYTYLIYGFGGMCVVDIIIFVVYYLPISLRGY
jgi:hypothetical protein